MCLARLLKQRMVTPTFSVNFQVFITEAECVYCAVQADILNIFHVYLRL